MSHIGTPEWQSFELRMQERARVRRASRRRRRIRRASGAAVLVVLLAGATGAYVDVMIEPGPDVAEPFRPFSPRGVVTPSLPAPMLIPASIDPPVAMDDPFASAAAATPHPLDAAAEPAPAPTPTAQDDAPTPAVTVEAENRPEPAPRSARPSTAELRTQVAQPTGTTGNGNVPPVLARSPTPAASPPVSQRPTPIEPEPERRDPVSLSNRPVERSPELAPATSLPERAPDLPPPAPSTASPPAAPPPPPAIDRSAGVRSTIERYRRAYEELDAAAAREVWPAVEQDALARAFGSLSSQRISFENCSIDVTGRLATASCRGTARVVPRVGGGTQSARRSWVFWLRQSGDEWVIERTQIR